jgi:hypothetical protein
LEETPVNNDDWPFMALVEAAVIDGLMGSDSYGERKRMGSY